MSMSAQEFKAAIESGEIVRNAKGQYVFKEQAEAAEKGSKYRNKITEVDGIKFHSAFEARYYSELVLRQKGGLIKSFVRQKAYIVCKGIKNPDGTVYAKPIKYIVDFEIEHNDGSIELVDVKGMLLPEYEIKRSLMWHVHGLRITEVFSGVDHREEKNKGRRKSKGA